MKACCDVEANKLFFDSKKKPMISLKVFFFLKLKTVIFAKQKTVSNCTYNYVKKVMTKILTIRTYSNEIYWFDWQIATIVYLLTNFEIGTSLGVFFPSFEFGTSNPCQLMLRVLWGGLCHNFEHKAKIKFFFYSFFKNAFKELLVSILVIHGVMDGG